MAGTRTTLTTQMLMEVSCLDKVQSVKANSQATQEKHAHDLEFLFSGNL